MCLIVYGDEPLYVHTYSVYLVLAKRNKTDQVQVGLVHVTEGVLQIKSVLKKNKFTICNSEKISSPS